MPMKKTRIPAALGKKLMKKYRKRPAYRKVPRSIATNTAAVRENYSVPVNDGTVTFFSTALNQAVFNRAQAVAQNFQQYRIKYVKLIFKPAADTFAPTAGNQIPQLYFLMNKAQSIPTTATVQSMLDMGTRPVRFDDKNIIRAYKPTVLLGADTTAVGAATVASRVLTTPWLSTNAYSQNPQPGWIPSAVEHLGCVFFISRYNATTPIPLTIDVEVVFQFRRPLEIYPGSTTQPAVQLNGDEVITLNGSS